MTLPESAWHANLERRIGRIIAGGFFLVLVNLVLMGIFLVFALTGPDYSIVFVPASVGALCAALVCAGLVGIMASIRASVRSGTAQTWGPKAVAQRTRILAYLWLAGIALTLLSGLLIGLQVDEKQGLAPLLAILGCLFQMQPRIVVWSTTRTVTRLIGERFA